MENLTSTSDQKERKNEVKWLWQWTGDVGKTMTSAERILSKVPLSLGCSVGDVVLQPC